MAEAQVAESKTIAAMPEPLMERVMAVYRHGMAWDTPDHLIGRAVLRKLQFFIFDLILVHLGP
jgi:hypothetical protein